MLDKRVAQLGESADRMRSEQYVTEASAITSTIVDESQPRRADAAAKLLTTMVGHRAPAADIGDGDLYVMRQLVAYLMGSTNPSSAERRLAAGALSAWLGRIRSERIPGYAPKEVFENVPIPDGVAGAAGMSPDAISDPVARAKYEAAIRENDENNAMNSRQATLTSLDETMGEQIVGYLKTAAGSKSLTPTMITRCVDTAGLTSEEKADVLGKGKR